MSKIILFPYKIGSSGSGVLKQALTTEGIDCLKVYANRNYKPSTGHIIFNWGNGTEPAWEHIRRINNIPLFNKYESVRVAQNKLLTFNKLFDSDINIPLFTTDINVAAKWFDEQQVSTVFCRTLLNSSAGKGIVVAKNKDGLVAAPLYTEGLSTDRTEYRVHVINGTVIDVSEKRRKSSARLKELNETVNEDVRSHDRGWVYCRDNMYKPSVIEETAKEVLRKLDLDFGAVDLCFLGEDQGAFVFEVNTAPGLEEGSTATQEYVRYIKSWVEGNEYTPSGITENFISNPTYDDEDEEDEVPTWPAPEEPNERIVPRRIVPAHPWAFR